MPFFVDADNLTTLGIATDDKDRAVRNSVFFALFLSALSIESSVNADVDNRLEVIVDAVVDLQPLRCTRQSRESDCYHQVVPANTSDIFTKDDYPPGSIRGNRGGASYFKVTVSPETGKAARCDITTSSGFLDLDKATCKILLRRLRINKQELSVHFQDPIFVGRVVWIPSYSFFHEDLRFY